MGLYLYCVKEKNNSEFSEKGINGGKIFVVPYKGLEAIVSQVDLKEFSSNEIQRKADNLGWIKEKAQLHEQIIEEAMGKEKGKIIPVIPMKFGTIFKSKEKLEETLKKYYSKFKKTLENLAGKQEWGVKIYLNRKIFEKEVKKVSHEIQKKEEEMISMPEGVAYFMQKQIDDAVKKEADKTFQNYIENFFNNLKEFSAAGTKGKILEKELTGKSLPMTMNAIFLVSEKKLKGFIKEINNLNKEFKSKGFTFEYSGPWPPYNFV
ncbi:GvpL/GvpF family gas vesicle protein [Patescibacteria group bacterium]|nr:GvpL/GvpF family gas vesicle protein [Patescibacteria group bacterium]